MELDRNPPTTLWSLILCTPHAEVPCVELLLHGLGSTGLTQHLRLMPNNYQHFLAFIFALEEINRDPHLLPNISLGYEFHNFLYSHGRMLESSLILLTGRDEIPNYYCRRESKSGAVLTGTSWATAAQTGSLLELYRFPQVTFGSFDPMLRDNAQFPSLYQVAQKDTSLALAMVSLMIHFRWTWVGLLITEGHKSLQFLSDIKAEMDRNGLPMTRFDTATSDGSYNTYNAVCAVAHALHEKLLQQAQRPPVGTREAMVFSLWQLTFSTFHPNFSENGQFPSLYQMAPNDASLALGMVSLMLHFSWTWVGPVITGGEKGLQFLSDDCAPNASLAWLPANDFNTAMSDGSFSTHSAVHAVAHALQEMLLQQGHTQPMGSGDNVVFSPGSERCNPGLRKSPQEGQAACSFCCTPRPENKISNETDMEQCVKCPDHQYANNQRNRCLQNSVTFLAYEDPLGKALAGTTLSLTVLTAAVPGHFVKHRDAPIVKANTRALSHTLLISPTCCFLCSSLFIGRPNAATCVLQQTTFGAVFTVAVSTVLAKTITVVLAFKVTAPGGRMRQLLVSGALNSIIPICSLIQPTLRGVWMGTNPPYIDTDAHSEHGHIIIVCNKGSLATFYCILGHLGSLALASFTVAFLARNLPDTFNEAKFLTFSTLVFCSVWVTFLPVYHSTKGKVTVAMEVFSILASGAGLLGCILAPKCYIILLRPERNALYGVRDKALSDRKKPF
ncbi:vomeronasal type-2 receptor 116-like [Erethizon dorsatum]